MSGRGRRTGSAAGAVATAAVAAGAARGAYKALQARPPGGSEMWTRVNHRGEQVTLLEGPAVTAGAVAASALARGLPPRVAAALVAAGVGAAAFGGYDDLAGDGSRRGFRGHLGALASGEVTTGAVKLGGIGATGLMAGALLGGSPADVVINGGLAAGGANLLNLFDLRPGRALKVALAAGALLAAGARGGGIARAPARGGAETSARSDRSAAAAAPLGAAAALFADDLGERAMLGDAGANALGAMLGAAAGATLPRPARLALLAGIVGLTAASEVVSFSAVIQRSPALNWLDMLGRRPPVSSPATSTPATSSPATSSTASSAATSSAARAGVPPRRPQQTASIRARPGSS